MNDIKHKQKVKVQFRMLVYKVLTGYFVEIYPIKRYLQFYTEINILFRR